MKFNLKYLILLIAVVLIVALSFWLSTRLKNKNSETYLFNFSASQIARFKIINFTQGIEFKKNISGEWFVKPTLTPLQNHIDTQNHSDIEGSQNKKKVGLDKIVPLLTLFTTLRIKAPVAQNTELSVFEINPYSLHIEFFDAQDLHLGTVFIGKKNLNPLYTYVIRNSENSVYAIPLDLRIMLSEPIEYWQFETPQ